MPKSKFRLTSVYPQYFVYNSNLTVYMNFVYNSILVLYQQYVVYASLCITSRSKDEFRAVFDHIFAATTTLKPQLQIVYSSNLTPSFEEPKCFKLKR